MIHLVVQASGVRGGPRGQACSLQVPAADSPKCVSSVAVEEVRLPRGNSQRPTGLEQSKGAALQRRPPRSHCDPDHGELLTRRVRERSWRDWIAGAAPMRGPPAFQGTAGAELVAEGRRPRSRRGDGETLDGSRRGTSPRDGPRRRAIGRSSCLAPNEPRRLLRGREPTAKLAAHLQRVGRSLANDLGDLRVDHYPAAGGGLSAPRSGSRKAPGLDQS